MLMLMCKNLAELLQAEQPLFSIMLEQLERASGRPSVDVRLLAEIVGKVHLKTKALGLDPHDTTGPEYYHALQDLVGKHDGFMAARLGVKDSADVRAVMAKAVPFVASLDIPKTAWVMKLSSAKRLLKQVPPKQVMKHLRYRSVDSMLKREPICEIFGSLRFAESPAWQRSFLKKYASLTPMDFEVRKIEIINFDSKKWDGIADEFVQASRNNVTHLKELGVVLVLPLPLKRMSGVTLPTLARVVHSINEIRLYSAYFKMRQFSAKFGAIVAEILTKDAGQLTVAGHNVHWRSVHGHFAKSEYVEHAELFEPHLQREDLEWRKVEEVLYKIEPALHFWHDMDFVAAYRGGETISFNLVDNALNYANKLPYTKRISQNFKNSLMNEIMIRYIGQPPLKRLITEQLGMHASQDHAEIML
jgi:hypothetical protein